MKTKGMMIMATGLAAGIAAFFIARHNKRNEKKETYKFFKKNRHLTPAFSKINKYS